MRKIIIVFAVLLIYSSDALCRTSLLFENNVPSEPYSQQVKEVSADTSKILLIEAQTLKDNGVSFYYSGDLLKAITAFKEALIIYKTLNDSTGISACYNNIGLVYKELREYEMALSYYAHSLAIDKKLNDRKGMAAVYNNMGEVEHLMGHSHLALNLYQLSIRYEAQSDNPEGMATCYLNIGALLEENKLYNEADKYYEQSYKIFELTGNTYRQAQINNNKGVLFTHLSRFTDAKKEFEKSLNLKYVTQDKPGLTTTLINLGNLYILFNDTIKARKCFSEALMLNTAKDDISSYIYNDSTTAEDFYFLALESAFNEGNYPGMAHLLFYKGYVHFLYSAYKTALPYFLNSLDIAEAKEMNSLKRDNHFYLSEVYAQAGNYQEAHAHARKYILLTDSLNRHSLLSHLSSNELFTPPNYDSKEIIKTEKEGSGSTYSKFLCVMGLILSVLFLFLYLRLRRRFFLYKKEIDNTTQAYYEEHR